MKRIDLNSGHIKEVLDRELMIGSAVARGGKRKQFGFHVWLNEYRVTHDGKIVDSGQAEGELLEVYNQL